MRTLLCAILAALPAAAATCGGLASLALPHTAIGQAEAVPAGAFTPPGGQPIAGLPAFCRVAGSIRPSADSDIEFEVWLPESGWNGKLEGVGNGGFAGSIGYSGLASAIRHGYAAAATDTGHRAGGTDASWALGHPEKVTDFGYRAIHETALTGKALIKAYYGEASRRAYFNSCSNGGRQALMEAQRFPEDYDGIVAGAPANYWTHLLSNAIWTVQAAGDDASFIPPSKLAAIEAAALDACDANDGVRDGIIDSPDRCGFKPPSLLCHGADSDACLTAAQVTALEKVLGGIPPVNGRKIFPGYVLGGITGTGGWSAWITGSAPRQTLAYAFGTNFYANIVYQDKAWDWRTFQPARDVAAADAKAAGALNATDPDLTRFRARGGKLILYHGWSDAAISPLNTIDYYRGVEAKMGPDTQQFVRLFMVPGMQHCGGGPGPNVFGQASGAAGDATHDVNAALERWVETGSAPERIVATGHKAPGPAEWTRPLCPYPQAAHYKGTGSTDDAANFVCR